MTASIAAMRRRAERLQAEIARRNALTRVYTAQSNTTPLPGADRWPEFASQTWIRTAGTIAPFHPYPFQADLVTEIAANRNIIVNKSRQLGVSETVACYLACRAATEPGFTAVIFSKTQADSSELARRTRRMLNSIQGHTFRYATDSNTLISIIGGGTLHFLPGSPRAARGIPSCSVLWIDEADFVEGAEEIYRAASPTLAMLGDDGKVIVTSTPDTETGWFGTIWHDNLFDDWYDLIKQAKSDPTFGPSALARLNDRLAAISDGWRRIAIHYSQHPVYAADPSWATKTRESRKLTQSAWDTEYELSFGATDTQVYPNDLIRRATRGRFLECGNIGRTYVIAIDPNAGGSDFFVSIVVDITARPYAVVAMYRCNGKSTEYSLRHTRALIEDFMPQKVICEKQAMGAVVAEALQSVMPSYAIELFNTSRASKVTATDRILYLLEHDALIFPEGDLPRELRAFHHKSGGSREAAPGYNDDTVMALAIACSTIPETAPTAAFFENL